MANRDYQKEYHLRTYQVEFKERDISKIPWKQDLTLSEASFIVPSTSLSYKSMFYFLKSLQLDMIHSVVWSSVEVPLLYTKKMIDH